MEYVTLNNGVKMPVAGIGTFLLTPDEAENSVAHALEDGYRQMEKAYKEGKVKAIGLSNFNEKQIQEILDICEVKPTVLQTEVHPYDQEKKLKEFLDKYDIVIQAWYPLGHGDAALLQEPVSLSSSVLWRQYSDITFIGCGLCSVRPWEVWN